MVALGTPLLVCYLRLGWTGFIPFMAGGSICAGITAYALSGPREGPMIAVFTVTGVVSGLLFRMVLFGFSKHSRQQQEHTIS